MMLRVEGDRLGAELYFYFYGFLFCLLACSFVRLLSCLLAVCLSGHLLSFVFALALKPMLLDIDDTTMD